MKELELLQQKLEQLMKHFSASQAEKERLEKANVRQAAIIAGQEEKIAALETELQLKSVALSAGGIHTEAEKQKLKVHLDKVIRTIEKNIELL